MDITSKLCKRKQYIFKDSYKCGKTMQQHKGKKNTKFRAVITSEEKERR